MSRPIEIVEVSPRDGLQNEKTLLCLADKADLIGRLVRAGAKRIEAASFVNPKAVPAMAESDALMALLPRLAGVSLIGLALNEKGLRRAIAARCDEINLVMIASDGFGRANQGMSALESAAMVEAIAPIAHGEGIPLSVTISVAFGDPFDGEVDAGFVAELAAMAQAAGAEEIALGDTIGVADPWDVRTRIGKVRQAAPKARLRMHFHNTRGQALANVFAAVEAGVDVIDSSCGGIGGCPFAPRATGNVATEDVVYMLHRAGFQTGLDLEGLIETAHWLGEKLGRQAPSMVSRAGGFP